MDVFTQQYIKTALWSSTDDDDMPLDEHPEDLAEETLVKMEADCAKFQRDNAADLEGADLEKAGHDFWLTRNGHGAGFWDGDWPEEIGKRLTEACKKFGESTLYRGDDGRIYSLEART